MTGATDFTKLVPGFDFLQSLMKNAGAGLPSMGQWIAPTLNPEELEKRIGELRTVQFWLEQNARMLGATIQALEVQRMTLTTLQTMNMPLEQMREAMTLRVPEPEAAAPPPAPTPAPAPEPPAKAQAAAPAPAAASAPSPGVVDPMQWWGALTQQFTELAASALKDVAAEAQAGPTAAPVPPKAAAGKSARKAARKTAGPATRKTAPRKRAAP
jgi:hypothetical protein